MTSCVMNKTDDDVAHICAICYDDTIVDDTLPEHTGCACRGAPNDHMRHVACSEKEITTFLKRKAVSREEITASTVAWRACRICKQDFTGEFAIALAKRYVSWSVGYTDLNIAARMHYASTLLQNDKYNESEECFSRLKPDCVSADDHFIVDAHIAGLLCKIGRHVESEVMQRILLDRARLMYGDDDNITMTAANNLAVSLYMRDKIEEAAVIMRLVYDTEVRVRGPLDAHTLTTGANLGQALLACKKYEEAERITHDVFVKTRTVFGTGSLRTLRIQSKLCTALYEQRRLDEAEAHLRTVCDGLAILPDVDPHEWMGASVALAETLCAQMRFGQCMKVLNQIPISQSAPDELVKRTDVMCRIMRVLATNRFKMGTNVTMHGLVSHPHYNGVRGCVVGLEPSTLRFDVKLSCGRSIRATFEKISECDAPA